MSAPAYNFFMRRELAITEEDFDRAICDLATAYLSYKGAEPTKKNVANFLDRNRVLLSHCAAPIAYYRARQKNAKVLARQRED